MFTMRIVEWDESLTHETSNTPSGYLRVVVVIFPQFQALALRNNTEKHAIRDSSSHTLWGIAVHPTNVSGAFLDERFRSNWKLLY